MAGWLLGLLKLISMGAETLPVILALGLIAGRRGHGQFCLAWGEQQLKICRLLALFGFFWLPCAYVGQLVPYGGGAGQMLATLLTPAGMPWLTGFLLWLCGLGALGLVSLPAGTGSSDDRYCFAYIRQPFCLLFLAFCFFFVALLMPDWPGAGLPAGLGWDRALPAIFRHAMHACFAALCPAGALSLVLIQLRPYAAILANQPAEFGVGIRWLAFWAAMGYLPGSLQTLGISIGMLVAGHPASLAPAFAAQLAGSIFLGFGILLWFWQLFSRRPQFWLALVGLLCLCFQAGAGVLVSLFI